MAGSSPSSSFSWKLRKRIWSVVPVFRFNHAPKPESIAEPKPNERKIAVLPFGQAYPEIPLKNVLVFDRLPKEEDGFSGFKMRAFLAFELLLKRMASPMQENLSEIDADIGKALADGLTEDYRKAFRAPTLPKSFEGAGKPELGDLAVESPYSVFLERGADGLLQWDFRVLGDFEHHEGLRSLGLRVVFSESADTRRLTATEIDSRELGTVRNGDPDWAAAKTLAICAATTHLSLTRHFNYVHLVTGNHWDVATRNHLPSDHPLYRLVWPHLSNSLYTNHGITRPQLLPNGDFVNIFSFTHDGLMKYYDAMYERYDVSVTDAERDWERRGLADASFECPSHENLCDLFDVMHQHAKRYVDAYYASDEDLQADQDVGAWLEGLEALIPNGIKGALGGGLGKDGLARLIAGYIYEGNTIHDLVGTTLWDYQLWADRNPTRVYQDGRRVPVDVFQRMINNNFGLQLERAPLLADYGHLALDTKGAALFTRFYEDCKALQARYDQSAAGPWRMEPKNLEISMNG